MTKTSTESARSPLERCQEAAHLRSRAREVGDEPLTVRYIAVAAGVAVIWVGLWLAFITWVLASLVG